LAQRVAIHYHLKPLDRDETKEYIRYRLARAGGSGIFTASALDKLYDYTQGVPRRINAWCDLALVAAFAEGRQEIDREFLETVVAAQGESLEGPDRTENGPEEELAAASNPQESWLAGDQAAQPSKSQGGEAAGNNLRKEVWELSARVARLEGMVLDLTGQLMPALNKFYSQQPATPSPEAELPLPALPPDEELARPHPETSSPRSRRWWSRFFIP